MMRNSRDPLLDMFDAPDGYGSAGRRNSTTTATQALLLINGSWALDRSRALAERLERFTLPDNLTSGSKANLSAGRIVQAFRLAYGREPEPEELSQAAGFLATQARRVTSTAASADREAFIDFCHALLNSSEFLYVD
jgi:hypothetical protein